MQTATEADLSVLLSQSTLAAEVAPIRTWLFVPATKLALIAKAFAKGADAVIVDLEDTVAATDKAKARQDLLRYFAPQPPQPLLWLRINQSGSTYFEEDLKLCQQIAQLAGIVLAKAENAADIEHVHQCTGLPVIAMIETALGLYQLETMAKASGLRAFSYGFLDLCNDLNVQIDTPAAEMVADRIRYQLLLTSRVHQLWPPIDSIYPDFQDDAGLQRRVQQWSQLGMSGMLCIHPNQIAVVEQSCQPTQAQLDFARRVVTTYQRSGQAVFQVDGQMIDAPVFERCLRTLASDPTK